MNMQHAREEGIKAILDAVVEKCEDAECAKACTYSYAPPKHRDGCNGKILSYLFAGAVFEAGHLLGNLPNDPPYPRGKSILSLAQRVKRCILRVLSTAASRNVILRQHAQDHTRLCWPIYRRL